MKYAFILFILSIISAALPAQQVYHRDTTLSDSLGLPRDSTVFYFPSLIHLNSKTINTEFDAFRQSWYSSALCAFKEPILSNFYLGHDRYRFLWLRSFHRPFVFTISKRDSIVLLTVKALDRQPRFMDIIYKAPPPAGKRGKKLKKRSPFFDFEHAKDSTVKADRKANIVFNQTKILTLAEWKKFEDLLTACDYWNMSPSSEMLGLDGARWIIEAHLHDRYYVVDRWSPEENFKTCGKFLMALCEVKEEIY